MLKGEFSFSLFDFKSKLRFFFFISNYTAGHGNDRFRENSHFPLNGQLLSYCKKLYAFYFMKKMYLTVFLG